MPLAGPGPRRAICSSSARLKAIQARERNWSGNFMCRKCTRMLIFLLFFFALFGIPAWALAQTATATPAPDAPATQAQIAALQQAVAERTIVRRQRLDAGLGGAGAADDRPRPGAVLRRPGAQEEHSGHHDAELRHDGPGDRSVGAGRLLAGLRARQRVYRRI